jgi:two-component system, sensor histidine kinase and response regulator
MMRIPCQKKNIDLVLEIDRKVPELVIVDIQRVKQVFLNLLQNAIKFTYQG